MATRKGARECLQIPQFCATLFIHAVLEGTGRAYKVAQVGSDGGEILGNFYSISTCRVRLLNVLQCVSCKCTFLADNFSMLKVHEITFLV